MTRRSTARTNKNRAGARRKRANERARGAINRKRADALRFALNRLDTMLDELSEDSTGGPDPTVNMRKVVEDAILADDRATEPERLRTELASLKAAVQHELATRED